MPQQQGLPTSICFPLFSTVFAYRALLEDEQLQGLARRTARFGNKPRKRSKTDRTDVSLRQQAIQRLAIARGDAVAIAMASMIDQPDAASLDRDDRRVVGGEQPVVEDGVAAKTGGVEGDDRVVDRAHGLCAAGERAVEQAAAGRLAGIAQHVALAMDQALAVFEGAQLVGDGEA